ncbi:hypothetical protein FGB62_113g08 [Gracilaria domingensis]|nr:hypothetical protein FGB62_113g08 [Gracilaria domingensis]
MLLSLLFLFLTYDDVALQSLLLRQVNVFTKMKEIVLPFSSSVFNVIKYIGISFILTPLLEYMLKVLIERIATLHVLRGRHVDPIDTGLGIFSLHSTYWGKKRNRFLLLGIGVCVIALELLLEFSFSAEMVSLSTNATVWIPPSHRQRYNVSTGMRFVLDHEPMQFLVDASNIECVLNGNFNLLPHHKSLEEHMTSNKTVLLFDKSLYLDRSQDEIAYFVEDTFTVRVPLRDAVDETITYCSADVLRARVKFFVPFVYRGMRQWGEGVETGDRTSDYAGTDKTEYIRRDPEYANVALENLTRHSNFYVGETPVSLLFGNNTICCGLTFRECAGFFDYTKHLCGLRGNSGFSIAVAQGGPDGWEVPVVSAIIMYISGDGIKKLYDEDERQLRLLLLLVLYGTEWRQFDLIRKGSLQELAKISLLVANEEGVSGLKRYRMERNVYHGESEQASIKPLALIPATLIVLFLLILIVYNSMVSRKIALANGGHRMHRLDLTLQGLRNQCLRDIRELNNMNLGKEGVAYKLLPLHLSCQVPMVCLLPVLAMMEAGEPECKQMGTEELRPLMGRA